MSRKPKSMPPRCAKLATPGDRPLTPKYNSIATNRKTIYFAYIGIGGNISITMRFGNAMPKASKIPNTPPEAPTVG